MATYNINTKLSQVVTREISLVVQASSEEEAMTKTREALSVYPEPVETQGISRIATRKMQFWIPRDIEFVSVREEKTVA